MELKIHLWALPCESWRADPKQQDRVQLRVSVQLGEHSQVHTREGNIAINPNNLGNFCQIRPRTVHLCQAGRRPPKWFLSGRLAVPKTLKIYGEHPNRNNLVWPPTTLTLTTPWISHPQCIFCGTFSALIILELVDTVQGSVQFCLLSAKEQQMVLSKRRFSEWRAQSQEIRNGRRRQNAWKYCVLRVPLKGFASVASRGEESEKTVWKHRLEPSDSGQVVGQQRERRRRHGGTRREKRKSTKICEKKLPHFSLLP